MSKIRVYELAKELTSPAHKVTSKDIIAKAQELNISVENHLSQLDETEAIRLEKAVKNERDNVGGAVKRVRRSVVRRRRSDTDTAEPGPDGTEEATEAKTSPAPHEQTTAEEEVPTPEAETPDAVSEEAVEAVEVATVDEEPTPDVVETVEAQEEDGTEAAIPPADSDDKAVEETASPEAEVDHKPEEVKTESPEAVKDAVSPPAPVTKVKTPAPLKLSRKKKSKEGFTAVVVSMPEEPVEPPPRMPTRIQPSMRELEKEDRAATRRKGKKLIYDRRREPGVVDSSGRRGKTRRRKTARKRAEPTVPPANVRPRKIEIMDTITVSELANKMAIKGSLLLRKLVEQGIMTTLNDTLDYETAAIITTDLGYDVANIAFDVSRYLDTEDTSVSENLYRPPVVTIMGHVDHGKTSLLDHIQTTDIAGKEAGGITQRIGAYVVQIDKGDIVFIDTPGHEAFTAMRARGAMVTDIVILVVAADDGVMPQTIEAIKHAKAGDVPIIVAVNKMDKPEADAARVRRELAEHDLLPEDWGGTTIFVEVSAKTGSGIPELLENLVLQAEILELSAIADKRAKGTIIESRLEKGRGPVASVIIQDGTLRIGDVVVAGAASGRVRALLNDKGKPVDKVTPSYPAEIIGLDRVPAASEVLYVVEDEKTAKMVTDHLEKKGREERLAKVKKPTFDQLFEAMEDSEVKTLKVLLKADTQGSVDAIKQGLEGIISEQVKLEIIQDSVGVISENDINLAVASNGLVLGFNVKADVKAKEVADAQDVRILTFSLIHELLDKTIALMEGKLEMIEEEVYLGKVEIRQVFNISRIGKIAGSYVLDGKITRGSNVRVQREGEIIHSGRLSSLKRFKEDVREVAQGYECGVSVDNFNDIKEGDIIEAFEIQKVAAKL
jgi:translation initiation factor IF-2